MSTGDYPPSTHDAPLEGDDDYAKFLLALRLLAEEAPLELEASTTEPARPPEAPRDRNRPGRPGSAERILTGTSSR